MMTGGHAGTRSTHAPLSMCTAMRTRYIGEILRANRHNLGRSSM